MRLQPRLLVASVAGAAALSVGVGSALAVASHRTAGGTCKYSLTNNPLPPSPSMSGSVKCGKPAGKGKASISYMPNLKPKGMSLTLVYSGTFKDKFKHGTISGKFSVSGVLLPPPPGKMTGKFKITGGTGKLSKAHGGGTMTCSAPSPTPSVTCTQVLTKGKL